MTFDEALERKLQNEPLVFAAVCDWAGLVRGKAFPEADLDSRLAKGMGYTHSNIMLSCFGPILTTPFGTGGDLISARSRRPRGGRTSAAVRPSASTGATLQNTDGRPWNAARGTFSAAPSARSRAMV